MITYDFKVKDKNQLFEFDKNNDKNHWSLKNFETINNIIAAFHNNKLVGFLIYDSVDIIEILRICIAKKYRNMGIGANLISKLPKKDIILEVRDDNIAAINLYKKLGFNQINKRKKYYNNQIDALIMQKIYIINE